MTHVQSLVVCEHTWVLRRSMQEHPHTVPLHLLQHFHKSPNTKSCHSWSPHRLVWMECSHWVGSPLSWDASKLAQTQVSFTMSTWSWEIPTTLLPSRAERAERYPGNYSDSHPSSHGIDEQIYHLGRCLLRVWSDAPPVASPFVNGFAIKNILTYKIYHS